MYNKFEHSAVAEYSFLTKRSKDFDKVDILTSSSQYYYQWKMMEVIEIKKHKNNFNKDEVFETSNA